MYFYLERIYLKKVTELINRKDPDTAKSWCKKNNLKLYRDSSGYFVYKIDFDLAYDLPLINQLKIIYGTEWRIFYEMYLEDKLTDAVCFKSTEKKETYVPVSDLAKKLMKKYINKQN